MDKKVKILGLMIILMICLVLSVSADSPNELQRAYNYNSETIKNSDGTNTLIISSRPIYLDKLVNLTYDENEDLLLEWKSYKLKIILKIKEKDDKQGKEKNKPEKNIKDYKSSDIELIKNKSYLEDKYEFSWKFKDIKNRSLNLEFFSIELEEITPMTITNDGRNFYLPDGLILNLDDLIQNNFTLEKLDSKKIKISNDIKKGKSFDVSEIDLDPTITYNASKDTYIYSNNPDDNYGDSTSLFIDDGLARRILIYFNLGTFPANATISSANLSLYTSTTATSQFVEVYTINNSWDEGTGSLDGATWNNGTNGSAWNSTGGDYNSTQITNLSVGSSGTYIFNVTKAVNWWSDGYTNNGLILLTNNGSAHTYYSRERTSNYPTLTLTYTPKNPSTNLIYPLNNSNLSTSSINFTCNSTLEGLDTTANITGIEIVYSNVTGTNFYTYKINSTSFSASDIGSSNKTAVVNWSTNLSQGTFYWACIVNTTYSDSTTSRYWLNEYKFLIDSIFPKININYPANNTNYTINSVNVNYTVSDTNLKTCSWTQNAGKTNTTISCGNNITSQTWPDGIHNISIYAKDISNNINSSSVTFRTDATIPTLNIIYPSDVSEIDNNESVPLNYSSSDGYSGVSACWWNLDNGVNETLTNCQNTTFNATVGSHTIYLYSNDTYNNLASKTSHFTIVLNTTGPTISLNQPLNATYWNNKTDFYFNYTAVSTSLSTCELWANFTGSFSKNYTWVSPNTNVMNYTYLNLTEGYFIWNIKCNDTSTPAGRFSTYNNSFTIDETYPTISNYITTNAGSQIVSFYSTVTDKNSNTSSCKYTVYNSSNVVDIVNDVETSNKSFTTSCSATQVFLVSDYGNFILSVYTRDLANNEKFQNTSFTVSASSGTPEGGGGVETVIEVPSNKTFCGDGICQAQGNDLNISEDFYNCPQDCPGFDVDSAIFGCLDMDPATACIWDNLAYQYILIFFGIGILVLSFSTVKSQGKNIPTIKYIYYKSFKRK